MFFPYGTDAPVYYWPFITVLMIVLNTVVFVMGLLHPEAVEPYMLEIGNGLHPVQWLGTNFLHANLIHLFGNMIALWAFGLVVEGKLGPWKTLVVYLGIGCVYGATVQILMLHHEPTHCLGASAVVFAFMAIALVWAPENSMDCFLMVYFRAFYFEVQIKFMVAAFLALELLVLFQSGGALSSEFLHVVGAFLGFGVAIAMLKWNWVDCEHWDIFSVFKGEHEVSEEERRQRRLNSPEIIELREEKKRRKLQRFGEELRLALEQGKALGAFVLVQRLEKEHPEWKLPAAEHLLLIQGLIAKKHWKEAILSMKAYLEHYDHKSTLVRLRLAQAQVQQQQPRAALKTLSEIEVNTLDSKQYALFCELRGKAENFHNPDTYELADS